jgi:hypothetical protein
VIAFALAMVGANGPVGFGLLSLGAMACILALAAAAISTRPRISERGNCLWLRVRWFGAEAAPFESVEGFLLGTGELPVSIGGRPVEAATLVIKLADAAQDLADRPTNRALAGWCDHYVRLRGAFCEPLDLALVNSLNERLAKARRERSGAQA